MRTLLIASLIALCSLPAFADEQLSDDIRYRLENIPPSAPIVANRETIHAVPSLLRLYQARQFRPAWLYDGQPTQDAWALLTEIERSAQEGLQPEDYHLRALTSLLPRNHQAKLTNTGQQVDLELLLSDAWLLLASHYLAGRVDPVSIDPEWVPSRRQADLPEKLAAAILQGKVDASLHALLPQQPGYARLRALLAHYRELARNGDWQKIPGAPAIEPGTSDPRVRVLRQRLLQSGESSAGDDHYDDELVAAVQHFQRRHGLTDDGIVGKATLAELNIGPQQRVQQIEVNLERWRWMPADLGRRHVRVNIADFHLETWEDGRPSGQMKVIVGKPYRKTPLFSDKIRYLVFNPAWEVPPMIAIEDKLPQFRKDPESLRRNGFALLSGQGGSEVEIDPTTVDWHQLGKGNFPYRLRQKPGKGNALGKVKIMFPNRFNVYLHDTANPELFGKGVRTFSSGCIRVGEPLALSQWLLSETKNWDADKVAATMASEETHTAFLQEAVPVHLQYMTAWVNADGEVHFRPDIYQRDRPLHIALKQNPGQR